MTDQEPRVGPAGALETCRITATTGALGALLSLLSLLIAGLVLSRPHYDLAVDTWGITKRSWWLCLQSAWNAWRLAWRAAIAMCRGSGQGIGPCPFCGGYAIARPVEGYPGIWVLQCSSAPDKCPIRPSVMATIGNLPKAIEAWNHRAGRRGPLRWPAFGRKGESGI